MNKTNIINVISLLILISAFTSCNPSSKNSNQSVFAEAPHLDADNLKHIEQQMVPPACITKI